MADKDKKIDPFDVAALEKSLNDSATRVSTIWVSFLIFSLYLLTAAATVTHRQLLLNEPVKLPVLNIDLPLRGFFFLAPILFVIFHAYVLIQVVLLARTAVTYSEAVDKGVTDAADNARVRQRLANTLFAQIFAGSPRERTGWLGGSLKAMAWITLAVAPILVVLAFQFAFLPYHSHLVTWTHRALLIVDLVLAFSLWPLVLDARRDFTWADLGMQIKRLMVLPRRLVPKERRHDELVWFRARVLPLVSCVLFVLLSLSLATFPGEPHVNLFTGQSLLSVQCERWFSVRFDRLSLSWEDFVDDEKLDKIEAAEAKRNQQPYEGERTRNFGGRDLNCVDFGAADLRRVNFSNARLSGAVFLQAQLQGANLSFAILHGADLSGALLQGANLSLAKLQGATLRNAQLQGADVRALLQGADLESAQLQGANLSFTFVGGAGAQLQGANLTNAQLDGADLAHAHLQGADFSGALLQGASFNGAQLQGANLEGADLTLALFSEAFLWRTKGVDCSDARTINPQFDAAIELEARIGRRDAPTLATPQVIEGFINSVITDIPGSKKIEVREQLHDALAAEIPKDDLAAIETTWRACASESASVSQVDYDRKYVVLMGELVCDATSNRKEIAAGIIRNWHSNSPDRPDFSRRLARDLLDRLGKACVAKDSPTDSAN